MAGLGIKDPAVLHAPARMAGILSTLQRAVDLHFPEEACQLPSDFAGVAVDVQRVLGAHFEPLAAWVTNAKPSDVGSAARGLKVPTPPPLVARRESPANRRWCTVPDVWGCP